MPMMISLRKLRLSSTLGHTTNFEASTIGGALKPSFVHPLLVPEALAKGCVYADGSSETELPDNDAKLRTGFEGKLRLSLLMAVYQRLVTENATKNFTAGGTPHLQAVSRIVGFDVDPKELKKTWQEFQTATHSGDELSLHPDAQKVLDILDAEGRADLLAVAVDQGFPEEEVKGLQTKDLRKHLLAKYAGLTTG